MIYRQCFRAIVILALIVDGELSADWPHFQGPAYDGTAAETGLIRGWGAEGPPIVWNIEMNAGFGGAAVAGNEVFILDRVGDEKDALRVISLEDGAELWRCEIEQAGRLPYPGPRSVPAVTDERVFAVSGFGRAWCIDRRTRALAWEIDYQKKYQAEVPRWGYAQSPLLLDGLLILAPLAKDAGLVAVNPADGGEVWRAPVNGESFSSPLPRKILGETRLVFVSSGGFDAKQAYVNCFEQKTGRLLWSYDGYKNRLPIPCVTMIGDDRMFITGGYDAGSQLVRIVEAEGNYRFEEIFRIGKGSQLHLPVFHQDHLYLTANENSNQTARGSRARGGLMCIDLLGNEKWRTGDDPNFGRGGVLLADGLLLIQDGWNGRLRLVEPTPDKYTPLAEADVFDHGASTEDLQLWAPLALARGRLLMRSQDKLLCIRLAQ